MALICFNSKMVRLKVEASDFYIASHQSFNSKMVRLKGFDGSGGNACVELFQFQNGAIKSPYPYPLWRRNVSIPKWCD